jgi:hypothetical protein
VLSFSDYVRHFGPIHPRSYLGYAISQFFDNGGSDAYVFRLTGGKDAGGKDIDLTGKCTAGGLTFAASSPGDWSKFYGVQVKVRDGTTKFTVSVVRFAADDRGEPITKGDALKNSPPVVVEVFPNLSTDQDDARYVKEVLEDEQSGSLYVRWASGTTAASDPEAKQFTGGELKYTPKDCDEINTKKQSDQVKAAAAEDAVLDRIDLFNLLCVPGLTTAAEDTTTLGDLATFCQRRRAMLIADCEKEAKAGGVKVPTPAAKKNAAFYFPWLKAPDALSQGRITDFPPCGFVAGLYARTDATRGVWKAPAGTDAGLVGVFAPKEKLTDKEIGTLNPKAVNCLRALPVFGPVSWGARTLDGNDEVGSEWKYVPVRRTALFIEETLFRATKWVVFEPNDEPLWAQLRLNVGAFLQDLFRQGAFQGRSPREAYFVKCDAETTTQNDINRGVVNVVVGFAPLKPAEFVVITLTQIAGAVAA